MSYDYPFAGGMKADSFSQKMSTTGGGAEVPSSQIYISREQNALNGKARAIITKKLAERLRLKSMSNVASITNSTPPAERKEKN